MKNSWLTTLFGLMAGLPQILPVIGLPSSFGHLGNTTVSGLITGIGILGLGAVAKDFNKSNAPNPTTQSQTVGK